MNGLEFRQLQQSLAEWADIPVLVMTASRFPPEALEPRLTHLLRKPLDLDELVLEDSGADEAFMG